jgi:hypothetical protein
VTLPQSSKPVPKYKRILKQTQILMRKWRLFQNFTFGTAPMEIEFFGKAENYQILSLRRSVLLLFGALGGFAAFITKSEAAIQAQSVPKNIMLCVDLREESVEYPRVLAEYWARQSTA